MCFQPAETRRTKSWRACWRATTLPSSPPGWALQLVDAQRFLPLAVSLDPLTFCRDPLRSSWTTSPSKPWTRLRRGTTRSSSWKTASGSFTTCSWTWPCWWRARWKKKKKYPATNTWCPHSINSCAVRGSWPNWCHTDAKWIRKLLICLQTVGDVIKETVRAAKHGIFFRQWFRQTG